MSELADIMEAIQGVSPNGKIRGLSPISSSLVERAVRKANDGNPDDLYDDAPGWLRQIADYWQNRIAEDEIADLGFEIRALKCALHGEAKVRDKIASLEGGGAVLAAHHANGIEHMGNGTRPTAAAVAGEGAAGTFDALRPWLRALEILDRAA